MTKLNSLGGAVLTIMVLNSVIVLAGVTIAGIQDNINYWTFTLVLVAFVTFFGFMALPGACDENGQFRETRIRLAITAALLLTYLVYFCLNIFSRLTEEDLAVQERLLPSLTSLLTVVLPFYFGASAAVEITERLKKNVPDEKQD